MSSFSNVGVEWFVVNGLLVERQCFWVFLALGYRVGEVECSNQVLGGEQYAKRGL